MFEQLSDIETKEKLEKMIIFQFDLNETINMQYFYEKLNIVRGEILKKQNKYTFNNPYYLELKNGLKAEIFDFEDYFFSFKLANILKRSIYSFPIKTKIKKKNNENDIDIISFNQLKFIITQKELSSPVLFCNNCEQKVSLDSYNIISHRDHILTILDSENFNECKNEEELNNFFKKENFNFESAISFESNFDEYFNKKNRINSNKEFIYYDNIEGRKNLSKCLNLDSAIGNYQIFYGEEGIGKSITLIYTLKYQINHSNCKTLYIHCKYLTYLEKKNKYSEIRKILIDEIPFLFYNNFARYQDCLNIIKKFKFDSNNTIWDLIKVILKSLNFESKKCLIVFDQYSNKFDPKSKIENIVEELFSLEYGKKTFAIFNFMSMNNTDVKDIKISSLLKSDIQSKYLPSELNNIVCDIKFSKIKYQQMFEKVGKTLKNYHEISQIKDGKKLDEYYRNKKEKIKEKIIKFLNRGKNGVLTHKEAYNLMNFSVNIFYTKEEIKKLSDIIHFKYFGVKNIRQNYQIFYLYPVVEETLKEMYYNCNDNNQIVNDKQLSHDLIKDGGSGYSFDQAILKYLSPSKNEVNNNIPDIIISEKKQIPRFIPKNNEVNAPYIKEKIKIEKNKAYLIEQKVLGRKGLDFIIIDYNCKEPIIFAFKVSANKEKIYKKDDIKMILNSMISYLDNFFINLKIKKENAYFGYIFPLVNENKSNFKTMIQLCEKNNISYSYFCDKQNKILNINKRFILSIYEMVNNPFNSENILIYDNKNFGRKCPLKKIKNPKYEIFEDTKNHIMHILKEVYKRDIIDFKFHQSLNKRFILQSSHDFYYTENGEGKQFILIKGIGNLQIFNMDKVKKDFVENHIFNNNTSFDCYNVEYKGQRKKNKESSFESDEEDLFYPKINIKSKKNNKIL